MLLQKSKNHVLCTAHIPSALSAYTHPVTGKLESVSVGSKSGRLRRSSAISITIEAVASERFFADRIAKTLLRISHSGEPDFCLARKGKYLQGKTLKLSSYFSIYLFMKTCSTEIFILSLNIYMCMNIKREITLKPKI